MSACAPISAGDCAGNAAELLEFRKRAAAIAEHAVAALDQVFRNRQSDLADADEADCFHALTPLALT